MIRISTQDQLYFTNAGLSREPEEGYGRLASAGDYIDYLCLNCNLHQIVSRVTKQNLGAYGTAERILELLTEPYGGS